MLMHPRSAVGRTKGRSSFYGLICLTSKELRAASPFFVLFSSADSRSDHEDHGEREGQTGRCPFLALRHSEQNNFAFASGSSANQLLTIVLLVQEEVVNG